VQLGKLRSLQIVRGFAALLVVWIHVCIALHLDYRLPQLYPVSLFWAGVFGVDLFFVLSGYVIAKTAFVERSQRPLEFLQRRLLRIIPIYWVWTFAWVALALIFPNVHLEWRQGLVSLTFWPIWGERVDPINGVGWSLNYEMLFYLCASVCLLAPSGRRFPAVAALAAAVVGFAAVRLVNDGPTFRWLGSAMIFEFLAGAAIASLAQGWRPRPAAGLALIAAGVAIWLRASIIPYFTPHHFEEPEGYEDLLRVVFFGPPAVLIVLGAILAEPWTQSRLLGPLVFLGDASYSIYLTHTLVIYFGGFFKGGLSQGWVQVFALEEIVAAVIVGVVAYIVVERPLTRLLGSPRAQPLLSRAAAAPAPAEL
jgi:peptidoglycan/LPS O-acetylase OafA/YrhL